jgi:hypothetical protein
MDNQIVLNMLNNFMAASPVAAVKIMILSTPIRKHLTAELTDEQTKWLGNNIQQNPGAIIAFMNSDVGKQLTREIFHVYRTTQEPPKVETKLDDNFGQI